MNVKEICRILGNYLFCFAIILCLPLGVAIYYQFIIDASSHPYPHASLEFFETILICVGLALILRFLGRNSQGQMHRKESIILVVLIWIVSSSIGAIPYFLTNTLEKPIDAYFEAMSGFTTTGASMMSPKEYTPEGKEKLITIRNFHVPEKTYQYYGTITPIKDPSTGKTLTGVEAVSRSILFWRSFTQWLGGMGIVVLFLTVLPALGVGGKFLYQMEVTGPIKEAISPRIKETASLLWKLYLGFTIIQILLLLWTNDTMPLFDATCITFSCLSTGGFSTLNESIGGYSNSATEWVVLVFMVVGSINFALYFHCLRAKFYRIYVPDFFLFIISAFIGCALIAYFITGEPTGFLDGRDGVFSIKDAIRTGSFQAISSQTSTGFATANYDIWPFAPQMFMLLLMYMGGMSGATCGGIKTPRFYIVWRIIINRIESIFRPDAIRQLRIGNMEMVDKTVITVLGFFCIVVFFSIAGTVLYILDSIDPETSFGLMACMLNNIGMAFRAAGPLDSFCFLSPFSKFLSTIWMMLGRLEFYALLIIFLPTFWQRD